MSDWGMVYVRACEGAMDRAELDRLYVLVELLTKRVEALEADRLWPPAAFGQESCNRADPPSYEWLPVQGVSHDRS